MCKNRVKRKRKRYICAVLILALIFSLAACGKAEEGKKSRDGEYVSAVLDCLYKGRTADLAEITAGSESDAAKLRDRLVADQTSYLIYMFDIGDCSQESVSAIRAKVEDLYSKMKYEVSEDGGKITINYSPCLAMEELRRRLTEKLEKYEGETADDYAALVAETLGEVIGDGPAFGTAAGLEISLTDGKIDQETLGELDKKILPY